MGFCSAAHSDVNIILSQFKQEIIKFIKLWFIIFFRIDGDSKKSVQTSDTYLVYKNKIVQMFNISVNFDDTQKVHHILES